MHSTVFCFIQIGQIDPNFTVSGEFPFMDRFILENPRTYSFFLNI